MVISLSSSTPLNSEAVFLECKYSTGRSRFASLTYPVNKKLANERRNSYDLKVETSRSAKLAAYFDKVMENVGESRKRKHEELEASELEI